MDLGIPPFKDKDTLESKPRSSRFRVCGLVVHAGCVSRPPPWWVCAPRRRSVSARAKRCATIARCVLLPFMPRVPRARIKLADSLYKCKMLKRAAMGPQQTLLRFNAWSSAVAVAVLLSLL